MIDSRRLRGTLVAAIALAMPGLAPRTPAAGCEAAIGDPLVDGAGHDHANPAQHALATSNYEKLGHLNPRDVSDLELRAPVVDEAGIPAGDRHDLDLVRSAVDADGRIFGEVSVVAMDVAIEGTALVHDARYAALAGVSYPL